MVGLVGEIQLFIVYTIQLAMANYSHALVPFQLKGSYPLIVILQQVLEQVMKAVRVAYIFYMMMMMMMIMMMMMLGMMLGMKGDSYP